MADNLPAEKPNTDLSPKDLAKVHEFISEGMPGLTKLGESHFHRMTEMYMNGSSYTQISSAMMLPRTTILYMSHTYGWYPARQEYLGELQEKIKSRVIESKLESQDFILLLIQAYQKKIGKKLKQYLATDDPAHADDINPKEIDKLMKAIEMSQTLSGDSKAPGRSPAVGLNMGEGGYTIERSGDNKVTITPAIDKQLGNMLKKFADNRRAEQNKDKKPNKSDINEDQPTNEDHENEK